MDKVSSPVCNTCWLKAVQEAHSVVSTLVFSPLVSFCDKTNLGLSKSSQEQVEFRGCQRSFLLCYVKAIHSLLLFSHSVMSSSLRLHGRQHTSLPCSSPSPRVCSRLCPLSWWYHPTISSSITPFSSCFQSFPASGSFPMSLVFTSGGQSIGASASASVLAMDI